MSTTITYQDYLQSSDRLQFLSDAVNRYRVSPFFQQALTATAYFRGENTTVARKTILRARKVENRDEHGRLRSRAALREVVGNRIGSSFLRRFVVQQNQYLLSNGCQLASAATKQKLGYDFDHVLSRMGEKALLHGVCWGFWNSDHLEMLECALDARSGFFPLLDEMTGQVRLGVQFWQVSLQRPMYLRVFDEEGVTLYRRDGHQLRLLQPRRPYVLTRRMDLFGETVLPEGGYPRLPLFPLWGNPEHQSELTPAIRAKIDAYDRILSDFADNLDRANDIYWVLNNFGGTTDEVAEQLEEINRVKAIACISDGTGAASTAEPHTIEVPYEARQKALELLERTLYQDFMALDMKSLTGGSLTNVAIRTALANLDLKADRYEWEVSQFVLQLLRFLGDDSEEVRFKRQDVSNASEIVADIERMRGDITHAVALKLNPYIQTEEVDAILHTAEGGAHGNQAYVSC